MSLILQRMPDAATQGLSRDMCCVCQVSWQLERAVWVHWPFE